MAGHRSRRMRISRRVVNTRRHTRGYIAGGDFFTVPRITRLAREGVVFGVRVVGRHIQCTTGRRPLTDLPVDVDVTLRR